MKLVKFNRSQAPHVAGETRVVSEEKAAQLVAEGDEIVPSIFDQVAEPPPAKPRVLPNLTRSGASSARAMPTGESTLSPRGKTR